MPVLIKIKLKNSFEDPLCIHLMHWNSNECVLYMKCYSQQLTCSKMLYKLKPIKNIVDSIFSTKRYSKWCRSLSECRPTPHISVDMWKFLLSKECWILTIYHWAIRHSESRLCTQSVWNPSMSLPFISPIARSNFLFTDGVHVYAQINVYISFNM